MPTAAWAPIGLLLLAAGLWPLLLAVLLGHDTSDSWGAGCLATAGWLLVAFLTVQLTVARYARRSQTVVAEQSMPDLAALAQAMVATNAGQDWTELVLRVDGPRPQLFVRRPDGVTDVIDQLAPALVARVDQFDEAVQRSTRPHGRIEVRAQRDGSVRATVS